MQDKTNKTDKTERELKNETSKWLSKIEKEMSKIKETTQNKEYIINIKAYISDCKHFTQKGKHILAFEAIIWAWAWLQILRELKLIKSE
ncbi:MAG: DUF357 domain-containing protein [Nanoarchaeota archaeon]|nr:DUF357 domain-containing protein [Nanoarchaeota archaeon]